MNGIDQIKQKVKNKTITQVMALGGSERALLDDALQFLRTTLLPKESFDLNYHRFVAQENDLEEILSTLQTMPFLSTSRFVEVHNAEKFTADDAASVLAYVQAPSPSSFLLLVFNKIDKRNKLVSSLLQQNILHLFESPTEADQVSYILSESSSVGLSIDKEAAQFLALVLDGDLLSIKAALEKLSLACENQPVTIDVIEQHVAANGEQDVFILARLISEGKLAPALCALARVRNERENAIKFLGVLMWQFRVFVHIRHCMDRGMTDWDIRKEVSVYGDRYQWMAHVAQKRTITFHINRLTKLIECDGALKSTNLSEPFNLIEKVVYQSVTGF